MIFFKEQVEDTLIGIWKIEESKEELLSCFQNRTLVQENTLNLKSESRIIERLATRLLLKTMLNDETMIHYKESGKPYLKDTNKNISISHTVGYVAVILSPKKHIGIDIQCITEKVKRIKPKFISSKEYIDPSQELTHLLLHWSGKETLYKALGIGVNLKEDFFVNHFTPHKEGIFKIQETMSKQEKTFNISYKVTSEFVLTYTIEN